jgi:hypothetical protein
MAAQAILAASTIFFFNKTQSIIGVRFRAFSLKGLCASVVPFVVRQNILVL